MTVIVKIKINLIYIIIKLLKTLMIFVKKIETKKKIKAYLKMNKIKC